MSTLRNILENIKKELKKRDKIRENVQKNAREATSLSKQAILLTHQKRHEEAGQLLTKATEIISNLNKVSTVYPEIVYGGSFSSALQEHAEAHIFLRLTQNTKFVTPREINVPSSDYVLGLADVIGELRRLSLDALRDGNVDRAEECLKIMDEIYIELMALDESYMFVPGLRRKTDLARRIIEVTRGDVTQEIRRNRLEKYLEKFDKHVRQRQSSKKS